MASESITTDKSVASSLARSLLLPIPTTLDDGLLDLIRVRGHDSRNQPGWAQQDDGGSINIEGADDSRASSGALAAAAAFAAGLSAP